LDESYRKSLKREKEEKKYDILHIQVKVRRDEE